MVIFSNRRGTVRFYDTIALALFFMFSILTNSQEYRVKATVSLDPTNSFNVGNKSNYYIGMGGLTFSPITQSIIDFPECIAPFTIDSRSDYVIVADNQRSKTCYFDWSGPLPSFVNTYVEGNIPVTINNVDHDTFSVLHTQYHDQPISPCTQYSSWDNNTLSAASSGLTLIQYTFIPFNETVINTIPGNILSIDQKFKLEFQSGNAPSGWRYSIDNGGSWADYGDEELSLQDLGIKFEDISNSQIKFQGIACGNLEVYSENIITVDVKKSPPVLLDTKVANATCYGANNGSIQLTFKENIASGHRMRFFLYQGSLPDPDDPEILENKPSFPGTAQQTVSDAVLDLEPTENGYSATIFNLNGNSTTDNGNTILNYDDYFIIYQEVNYNTSPVTVTTAGVTPNLYRINQPTAIIPFGSITQGQCNGNTAEINFSALGGNNLDPSGSYSYQYRLDDGPWVQATSNPQSVDLTSNDQAVQIKAIYSIGNCESETEILEEKINAIIPSLMFEEIIPGLASSNNSNDGVISANYSGGTPNYTFYLAKENKDTSAFEVVQNPTIIENPLVKKVEFHDLGVGTYRITIVDQNECSVTTEILGDIEVTIIPSPTIVSQQINEIRCVDNSKGSISINVSGGVSPYNYEWTINGVTSPIQSTASQTISINDLSEAGEYVLKVGSVGFTEFNNPSGYVSTSITMTTPEVVSITSTTVNNISCFGAKNGGIVVTASGGISFEYKLGFLGAWTPLTNSTIPITIGGFYDVYLRNQYNCMSDPIMGILVTEPEELLASAISGNATINGGNQGSITLTISGGTPFSEPADPYTVYWTKDGQPFVSPSGATSTKLIDLEAGEYRAHITDANGCLPQTNNPITILEPEPLLVNLVQTVMLECSEDDFGEITASVQGGIPPYAYEWFQITNGNTILTEETEIIDNLQAGEYFVRVTDSSGVSVDALPLSIAQPDDLEIIINHISPVVCHDGATAIIDISVTGGTAPYSYLWSNGSTNKNLTNVQPGEYSLEVYDDNGCFAETFVTIDPASDPLHIADVTINHSKEYMSNDGSISVQIKGGAVPYNINWTRLSDGMVIGNSWEITNLSADTYEISISDGNGCNLKEVYSITQPDIVEATIINPSCAGDSNGSIKLTVNQGNGNFTYNWDTGETTNNITDLSPGNYTVTIYGLDNSPVTRTYIVESPLPLDVDLGENRTLCAGQDLLMDVGSVDKNATYNWTSDTGFTSKDPQVIINKSGRYTVMVTYQNGCSATGTVIIDVSDIEINAEFAISSQAFVGESLIAVDISYPLPEIQEWVLPENAIILRQDSDEAEFRFNEPGEYEIGIITQIGQCMAQQTKKVLVTENEALTSKEGQGNQRKKIESFMIYPNPTNGEFVSQIVLPEIDPISIKVYNFANNALMALEKDQGASSYSLPFNLSGLPSGMYAVVLETSFGNALRKVILK
ncbi:MAG: T9SS type A sorting domain-containing protein [Flavobacteriaceae bacterium]